MRLTETQVWTPKVNLGAKRKIAANDVFVLRAFASLKEGKPWVKPRAKYKEIRVKAWVEYFETAWALRYINISAKGVEVVRLTPIWYKYSHGSTIVSSQ